MVQKGLFCFVVQEHEISFMITYTAMLQHSLNIVLTWLEQYETELLKESHEQKYACVCLTDTRLWKLCSQQRSDRCKLWFITLSCYTPTRDSWCWWYSAREVSHLELNLFFITRSLFFVNFAYFHPKFVTTVKNEYVYH